MSFDAHVNFAYSTVATAPSPASSGTSLVVATGDGSKFPATPFNATVWPAGSQPTDANAEIVRVTNIATDTFTITRAQESSSARSIGTGDQIAATITAKTITDVEAAAGTLYTVSSSGTSLTIDYTNGNTQKITLTGNCTFTLSGFTSGDPDYLTLVLVQDATGSRLVTWPTITWIGSGVAPTLQTAASSVDSVVLFSFDGGTTVYGIAQTSASGLAAGTSFPGSPADGDLFYRTDRRVLYEYNATAALWLSLTRHYLPFASLVGSTSTGNLTSVPVLEKIYLESLISRTLVATTNNGSNFWTVKLFEQGASASLITSVATNLDTHDVWTTHDVSSVNVQVDPATFLVLELNLSKTGTPGSLFLVAGVICRSVG